MKERLVPKMEHIRERPLVSLIYKNNIAYTAMLNDKETLIYPHVAFRAKPKTVDLMIGIHDQEGNVITGFGLEDDRYGLCACLLYPFVAADQKATTEEEVVKSLVNARRLLDPTEDVTDEASLAFLNNFSIEARGTLAPEWTRGVFLTANEVKFPVNLDLADNQRLALGTIFDSV